MSSRIEAVPGGDLEQMTQPRYDDAPADFGSTLLDLLARHAPTVYERVNRREFGLTRPLDLLQGAITPTVRRGYAQLENGRYVLALGDVHVLNDPILGQGANAASQAAWIAGDAIAKGGPFDEAFCRDVEDRVWACARPVTEWTNAALHPPASHVLEVFQAAAGNKTIADEVVDNFNAPERNWAIFESPERARVFLPIARSVVSWHVSRPDLQGIVGPSIQAPPYRRWMDGRFGRHGPICARNA